MAPVADEINADLDRRVNNGIVLTDVKVRHINRPTVIRFRWSYHRRSPSKFTVWLRNVGTQKYHKARVTVWTSMGHAQVGLSSLNQQAGKYRLVLTKQNHYDDYNVYARSAAFRILDSDFN